MLRKLLLTGGLVLAADGTSAQFLIAQIISLLYLVLVIRKLPYEMDADDILQSLASISILFTLMAGFALKTEQEKETCTTSDNESIYNKQILGFVLCGINGFVFVFAIATLAAIIGPACRDCKKNLVRHKLKQSEDRKTQEALQKKFGDRKEPPKKSIRNNGKVGKEEKKETKGTEGTKMNKKNSTKVKPINTSKTKSKARSPSTAKRTSVAAKGGTSASRRSKSGQNPGGRGGKRGGGRGGKRCGGQGGRRKK